MSDSVTNVEIEDVLSSIRRLVSEDTKPSAANTQPKQPQKLVLTQADRIEEESSDAAKSAPDASDDVKLESTPELGAEADAPEAATLDLTAENRVADTSLEHTIAELEAAVDDTPDAEWEPDAEDVDASGVTSFAAWRAGRASSQDEAVAVDVPVEETQVAETVIDPETVEDADVVSASAPKGASSEDIEDTVAQAAEDAVKDSLKDAAEAVAETVSGSDDASIMDEDGLRELVRKVVQEELQGVLGERITRNVRKLVRREINRTLASKDLD